MISVLRRSARSAVPAGLLALVLRPGATARQRAGLLGVLLALWSVVHARWRRDGIRRTAEERELLRTASLEAYRRHYNERVPTIEEEFEIWGAYHQHRHEMRYDLVAHDVRHVLPRGGAVLDLGCGSALVADRIGDLDARYVGLDYGGHHITYAARKHAVRQRAAGGATLRTAWARGDGERLPFVDAAFDVVVFSEVIEHLFRPELAVWELARVLKPGGSLVLTTNNASQLPPRSPVSHPFAWVEKWIAAYVPRAASYRPWIWPWPVDADLLPPGAPPVHLPHTWHIPAETRRLLALAGMTTTRFASFEFPPPESPLAAFLERRGDVGRRVVDGIESVAQRTPGVRKLGAHLLLVARKDRQPVSPEPPPGAWPGPFSV